MPSLLRSTQLEGLPATECGLWTLAFHEENNTMWLAHNGTICCMVGEEHLEDLYQLVSATRTMRQVRTPAITPRDHNLTPELDWWK